MVQVLVDPKIYGKVPTTLVQQAAHRLQKHLLDNPPKGAKHSMEEIVEWDGTRIALECVWKPDKDQVLITGARQLRGKKRKPWR